MSVNYILCSSKIDNTYRNCLLIDYPNDNTQQFFYDKEIGQKALTLKEGIPNFITYDIKNVMKGLETIGIDELLLLEIGSNFTDIKSELLKQSNKFYSKIAEEYGVCSDFSNYNIDPAEKCQLLLICWYKLIGY
jgi:hypothetical protein